MHTGIILIDLQKAFGTLDHNILLEDQSKSSSKLNISYGKQIMKQYHAVECLGCPLDSKKTCESMAMKALKKVKSKVKFPYE